MNMRLERGAPLTRLAMIQATYFAAMRADPDDSDARASLLDVLEGPPALKSRRLAAYRRNFYGNLVNALEITYPVVRSLVGEAFFREAARQYIVARPSRSGDLNDYGADFDTFLAAYPHATKLPYLPDMARLEWAIQAVSLGPDESPATVLDDLAGIPATSHGSVRFECGPAVARVDSAWPIASIWRTHQNERDEDMALDMAQPERVLVRRGSGDAINAIFLHVLETAEAAFFDALRAGAPLLAAVESILTIDAAFDYGAALQAWIAAGWLRAARID